MMAPLVLRPMMAPLVLRGRRPVFRALRPKTWTVMVFQDSRIAYYIDFRLQEACIIANA